MTQHGKDRYAVFGNPIAHSKSPAIHAAFAEQTQQQMSYEKQLVEVDGFNTAADQFFRDGGKGLNVTAPFKQDAFNYAKQLSERAKAAGAVNTLALQENGSILGDNTDGVGLVQDITGRLGWEMKGSRLLILGAGGAVRGVLLPCLEQRPASLTVANRTPAKAEELVRGFTPLGHLRACGFAELGDQQFDIVINGTSASLSGDLPPIAASVFVPGAAAYDMMYASALTPFLVWAQAQGVTRLADGLGMLVGQAAEAFYLWRGVHPEIGPVLECLREQAD